MTAQDVITRVRKILKDDIEPYRISDEEFNDWINDAIRETRVRRPDFLVKTDGTLWAASDVVVPSDTINLPEHFKEALACHVAYSSYISDDTDQHNSSQADAMLNRFERLIQTL